MKLLVFLLLFSTTIYSQDINVITERFFQYNIKKNIVLTKELDIESEEAFYSIQEGNYVQITTDRLMNIELSSRLTEEFLKGRKIKEKVVSNTLSNVVHNITIDSNCNLFYREIEISCFDCTQSIYNLIVDDSSLVNEFNSKGVTQIVITYVQVKRRNRIGYIFIDIHKRFRKDVRHLYFENMDE